MNGKTTTYDSSRKGTVWLDLQEAPASVLSGVEGVALNRYPDGSARKLKAALASYCGIDAGNVVVGNGSDELIGLLVSAFGKRGVAFYEPTFSMYKAYCENLGRPYRALGLDESFQAAVQPQAEEAGLVFLCSPNSPTGNTLDESRLLQFAQRCAGVLVVDEAYFEYCGTTAASLLARFERLVVLRTLSKAWGLAGLRVGYALASRDIVAKLDAARSPFNVNALSQELAARAVADEEGKMRENVARTVQNREYLQGELERRGFAPMPSQANFLCVRCPSDAAALYGNLLERGVAVKNVSGQPALEGCLRVSIGSREELDALLRAIDAIAGEDGK
jgi:histidinol-phosphate aminotransferase